MTELIGKLVSNLNINEDQAKGGLGSILNLAKDKLDGGDFSKITDVISGASELMGNAPKTESTSASGLFGSVTSALGVDTGSIGTLMSLAGQFKSLNLDSDMIAKFAPIIMDFLKEKGGDSLKEIAGKFLS